jgi:hypothetical protein
MVTDPKAVLYKWNALAAILVGGVFFIGETVCENYRNKRNTELQFLKHINCLLAFKHLLEL